MHRSLAMTGILLLCIASAAGAETGLVAHYTFDGDSGPMAQDASGRGHDAKIIGGRITQDGHGHCLLLEAEEAYVDAGVSPDFEGRSGGAFELWFKPRELRGGLVNWSAGGRWQDIRLTLAFNTYSGGGSFLAAVANGRVSESLALAPPQLDVWTHVAVSFRGPHVTVYVDGAPVRSQTVNCIPHRQGLPLWIGKCEGLGRACFRGWIDEVRVYDRPITESEVLAHYKQHAEVMGKDTSHFDAPIVDVLTLPEPGTVMVIAHCALMRPIPDGATLAASLGKDGVPRVAQTVSVDSGGAPISVALDATQLVAGEYELRAEVRAPGGRTLGRPAAAKVNWPGRARDFENVRVLNNVVWELLNVEPGAVSGSREFSFTNPKRRWGFVSLTAEVGPGGKLQLARQRAPNDILITITGETTTTVEAMRPMPPGEHCIVLTAEGPCIVKKLVVRSIPELVYADYGCEPHVSEHGPYVGAFLDRYVLPNINTSIISGTPGDQPHIQRWLNRGGRWLNHCGVPRERAGGEPVGVNVGKGGAGTQPQPLTAEDAAGYIARTAGFSDPRFTGAIADEFGDSEPLCAIYAQAVRNLAADPQYKGKLFYPYANNLYNGPEGSALTRALVETGSAIAWKRYLKTQADVNSARAFLQQELVEKACGYRKAVPDSLEIIDVCFGYFSAPNEFLNTNPSVDYRTYLDMQFNLVANDPAFWATHGLMSYLASYCDEESVRWVAALMRHYGIEGHKSLLSDDPHDLPHMTNGDFVDGTSGWTIEPAETGSIRTDRREQFGWLQGRYPATPEGDTVLVTTRSDKRPNFFSQEIKDLQPGRLYSFRMFSADFHDMSQKERNAVTVVLDNVDLVPHKCFDHVGHNCYSHHAPPFDDKNCAWFNYHWRVFRAKGTTAKVTVSDWSGTGPPRGPIGQQLMYNFAHVRPYFPDGSE